MSGQTAIRGFTYQTISSVIQSLSRSDWEYVTVEPDTALDKVDIKWENDSGEIFCQQVKSSINNFLKAEIVTWLESMIADVPDAEKYQLFLIGNVANPVNDFIKAIKNKKGGTSISPTIDPYLDKIDVDLIVFQLDYLESKVRDEISRFLSTANYHLPHATISLIAGGVIYQFFQFSVLGARVSKAEFAEHLLHWVRFNYRKDLGIETKKSKFSVQFYDMPNRKFLSSIIPYQFNLNDKPLTEEFRLKVIELCRTISSIELPERIKPVKDVINLGFTFTVPSFGNATDADVSDQRKTFISERLKKWFSINVPENFFWVGNLKRDTMRSLMPMMGNGYIGTDDEKKKGEAINSLYWELHSIQEVKTLFHHLNSYDYYILVIENSGSNHDEELVVNLSIPTSIEVISHTSFYVPDDLDALEKLIKARFVRSILEIKPDSLITEYLFDNFIDIDAMGDLDLMYQFDHGSKRLELKKDKFIHRVERMMDMEIYTDTPGFTQLRYLFKKLNPGIRMAFPSILLFNAASDFTMNYEITSKHSSVVHKGELTCLSGEAQTDK